VINGTQHVADAVAVQAQTDLTTAFDDAAGRTPAIGVPADIGGLVLVSGVYNTAAAMGLTGAVTLDGQGDPNAVFIFQAGSTLTTASSSTVNLINGASPANVFWQVGSSATLGTNTTFVGTVLALTSITVQTGTTVSGRVLARNGAVTLDTNTIAVP
jgi:type VI secretion system secreted protein VgrG